MRNNKRLSKNGRKEAVQISAYVLQDHLDSTQSYRVHLVILPYLILRQTVERRLQESRQRYQEMDFAHKYSNLRALPAAHAHFDVLDAERESEKAEVQATQREVFKGGNSKNEARPCEIAFLLALYRR